MTTAYQDRPLPPNLIDAATEPWFAAAHQGVLRIRRCRTCRKLHWYPRPLCPFCQGDTEWEDCAGTGTIYSVSVTRRAGPTPFAIAYVRLDEGVTMLTNIVDGDLDALRIGQRVRVVFKSAQDDGVVPMFTPVADADR
jgi:uncharacterized OB-fold protein